MFGGIFKQTPRYQIGKYCIDVEKKICEGGYAYIYRAKDPHTKTIYALKKILLHDGQHEQMLNGELKLWKSLGDHPNIVRMYDSCLINENDTKYIMILMEMCNGGTLIDLLQKYNGQLSETQIIHILTDISKGIEFMHSKGIAHRDLKVENILLEEKKFKLCDFGSATAETLDFSRVNSRQIALAYEQFEKFTTMMYRPPEMIDKYLKYNVNLKADIWMFGCVVYTLCYYMHPFQDAEKLAILNAYYNFPPDPEKRISDKMQDFIRLLLSPNPIQRPDTSSILKILNNWKALLQIKLPKEVQEIKDKQIQKEKPKRKNKQTVKDQDLSEGEILKIQEKLRIEMSKGHTDNKPKLKEFGGENQKVVPNAPSRKKEEEKRISTFMDWGAKNANANANFANFDMFSKAEVPKAAKTVHEHKQGAPTDFWANFDANPQKEASNEPKIQKEEANFLQFDDEEFEDHAINTLGGISFGEFQSAAIPDKQTQIISTTQPEGDNEVNFADFIA